MLEIKSLTESKNAFDGVMNILDILKERTREIEEMSELLTQREK